MKLAELCQKFEKYRIKGSDAGSKTEKTLSALSDAELKDILGLPESATKDDVRLAHRKALITAHPDKNPNDQVTAQGVFTNLAALKEELDGRFDGTRKQKAATTTPSPRTASAPTDFSHAQTRHSGATRPSMVHSFSQRTSFFDDPLADILRDLCQIFSFGFNQRPAVRTATFPSHFSQHRPQAHFHPEFGHGLRFATPRPAPQPAADLFANFLSQSFFSGTRQSPFALVFTVHLIDSVPFVPLFCSKGNGLSDAYKKIPSHNQIPQTTQSLERGGGR